MKIVTVIPLAKNVLKEDLTYFSAKDIEDGSIVEIKIRNKKTLGIAISKEELSHTKSSIKGLPFNLKKIEAVKEHSIFREEFIKTGIELAQYTASSSGRVLGTLIPGVFKENYDKLSSFSNFIPLKKNTPKKIRPEKLLLQLPLEERMSHYKTLIRGSFAEKKSVFMVLPSGRDIDIFKEALSRGIENFTISIHSGLGVKKQIEQFKKIIKTEHPILIFGTAQFLSIPRSDIGTIILERESAAGYKGIARPYLDMRIFTELFAQKTGAKLILADTLLRFESIGRRDELSEVHALSFRLNPSGELEIKNPNPDKDKKFSILSDETLAEIKQAVVKKQKVFIFSLRKGLATVTVCRDCKTSITCKNCFSPLVLYLSRDGKKRMFVCNRCHDQKEPDIKCPHCGSWNLMPLGIGTDTVEEAIKEYGKKNLPKVKIFKLDKESAGSSSGAEKIIREFEESPGSILIGTEMAFFYMKERVALSVVASFDSLWSIPNFRMSEKVLHIIFSMSALTERKMIIQTKNTEDPAIKGIVDENLLSFVREELRDRNELGYPPYRRLIKISHLGNADEKEKARKLLLDLFQEYRPEIFSGFVARLKGKYTTNCLIKIHPEKWSLPEIQKNGSIDKVLLRKLSSLPPTFSINVDPEDLL